VVVSRILLVEKMEWLIMLSCHELVRNIDGKTPLSPSFDPPLLFDLADVNARVPIVALSPNPSPRILSLCLVALFSAQSPRGNTKL